MNSKIEISTRAAGSACVLSVLLLLASACSGSRSALSTEPLGAAVTTSANNSEKSNLAACGSMTKPCDPNNLGGQTCSSLGAGSGTLLCDPVTCSFDRSMCTGTGTQGGGGLGALLGAFARGQGGRAAMGMNMGMGRGGRSGMAAAGRGGSQGSREDGQSSEGREEAGAGGEKAEAGDKADAGDNAEGGSGGEMSSSEMTAGAGGQAGESAPQAGAGGDMSAAGAGGESGAAAPMSEMPDMQMQMMPATPAM